ncbi:DUF6281 family protein [Nocardioides sp. SR21]|uniref:DUF6281 family protein n=1 Tax=Nocardioides sp. SR21 TaxID=2919501 RepID=UPI001FA96D11|nr:DUF6281 family protein [Nocardioides sp. SR21]
MRALAVLLVVIAVTAVTSCGQEESGTADCAGQIRVDDVVYTSFRVTKQAATEHGTAERAECHDVGADAKGSVFPDDPATVTTWTFADYSPDQVLGVRQDKHSYVVFISSSVPDDERDQILAALE